MDPIEICAMPQDFLELFKRAATFRSSRFVRCQVARNDIWPNVWSRGQPIIWRRIYPGYRRDGWTEVRAAF